MTHSIRVSKPCPDFPLFPHATGRWAKKIRGKFSYFGPVTSDAGHGAQVALGKWLDQKDDLLAGRTPRVKTEGLTVRELCNRFLTAKQSRFDTGELGRRTFADYHQVCGIVLAAFGRDRLVVDLASDDFERLRTALAKHNGPVRLGNEVQRVRTAFKWAYESGLIAAPIRFGPEFKGPSKAVLRKHRATRGTRMFEAPEIRKMLEIAGQPLKTMILLGVNCGFGNHDCGSLPLSALDLEKGWVRFPRPKTGVDRRCPLWAETAEAIGDWLTKRPAAKDADAKDLVFLTRRRGCSWAKDSQAAPVAREMRRLLTPLSLHRVGRGFYALRHTFETIAGDSRDQVAVNYIMGHAPAQNDMGAVYRERIDDSRLLAVAEHVRRWLFGTEETE